MSENVHTSYFGQSLPHVHQEGSGQQPGTGEEIPGSEGSNGPMQTISTIGTQTGTNNMGRRTQTTPITPIDRTQTGVDHTSPVSGSPE